MLRSVIQILLNISGKFAAASLTMCEIIAAATWFQRDEVLH